MTPALVFNPSGGIQYAQAANSTSLADNLPSFSVAVWVKPASNTFPYEVIDKSTNHGQTSGTGWVVQLTSLGGSSCGVKFSFNGGSYTAVFSSNINDGNWHHIVAIKDSGAANIYLYVDNVLQATTSTSGLGSFSNSEIVRVGTDPNSSSGFYRGEMTLITIWNFALSSGDVNSLFTANVQPGTPAIANWPCDDGSGSTARDTITSNQQLNLTGITWATDGPVFGNTFNWNPADTITDTDVQVNEPEVVLADSITDTDALILADPVSFMDAQPMIDTFGQLIYPGFSDSLKMNEWMQFDYRPPIGWTNSDNG